MAIIKKWQFIAMRQLHVSGITLFPFILVKNKSLLHDKHFINHEHIHLRQQIEMLIIPFYLLYILHYLINRIRWKQHDKAYRQICFEREAYGNEHHLDYLKQRKWCAWIRYL